MTLTFTNAVINGGFITFTLPENSGANSVVSAISYPGDATLRPVITGANAHLFSVNELNQIIFLGTAQDFENDPQTFSINIQVSVEDNAGNTTSHSYTASIVTGDVDEKPTEITVTPVKTELDEGVYEQAVKLADIAIIDDATGTNTLVPLPDDSLFEYRNVTNAGAELWLKAGSELDYETLQSVTASIGVTGTGTGQNPANTTFELQVNNIIENNETIFFQYDELSTGDVLGKVSQSDTMFLFDGYSTRRNSVFEVRDGELIFIGDPNLDTRKDYNNLMLFNGRNVQIINVQFNQEPDYAGQIRFSYENRVLTIRSDQLRVEDDGDTLTYVDKATTKTRNGSYQIVNGVLTYTPNTGFTGEDAIYVEVTDSRGGKTTGAVEVHVRPAIEYTGSLNAMEDSPYHDPSGRISIVDPERPMDEYTLVLNDTSVTTDGTVIAGTYGTFTVDKDGTLSYALDNSNPTVEALDGDTDDTDGAINKLTETVTVTFKRPDDPATPNIDETDSITRTYEISIRGLTDFYGHLRSNHEFHNAGDDISIHQGNLTGYMYGGVGDDVLVGSSNRDFMYGRQGDDTLYGFAGDDILVGFSGHYNDDGNDILFGGAGDDKFSAGNNDIVDGGADTDLMLIRYLRNTYVDLRFDPFGDTTKWGKDIEGNWITGTGEGFTYTRLYHDLNENGLDDRGDFYLFFKNIESFIFRGSLGNDVIIGGPGDDRLSGRLGDDYIVGNGGDDQLTAYNNDIINGGTGTDRLEIINRFTRNDITFDPTADKRQWGRDGDGNWITGTGENFSYSRIHIDDRTDTTVYHKNIEKYYYRSWHGNDRVFGGAGDDFLAGGDGNDEVSGRDGNDTLWGGRGNDVLIGGKGFDILKTWLGNDIYVLGLNQTADDTDFVVDFSETDKIRVDTENGNETTLEALKSAANLRWTNDSNYSGPVRTYQNHPRDMDTIIYDTRGTASEADDIMLMVIEDYTELTIADFDIV